MTVVRAIAEKYGRRHAFILRYEDLCASPYLVPPALDKWLPGLGARINIGQAPAIKNQRRRYLSAKHEKLSIPDYCNTRFLPYLPYSTCLPRILAISLAFDFLQLHIICKPRALRKDGQAHGAYKSNKDIQAHRNARK